MRVLQILVAILFIVLCDQAYGQATGHKISGFVSDEVSREALGFATVSLLRNNGNDRAQFSATQTGLDGTFNFVNVPADTFILQVSYIGYKTVERHVDLR